MIVIILLICVVAGLVIGSCVLEFVSEDTFSFEVNTMIVVNDDVGDVGLKNKNTEGSFAFQLIDIKTGEVLYTKLFLDSTNNEVLTDELKGLTKNWYECIGVFYELNSPNLEGVDTSGSSKIQVSDDDYYYTRNIAEVIVNISVKPQTINKGINYSNPISISVPKQRNSVTIENTKIETSDYFK